MTGRAPVGGRPGRSSVTQSQGPRRGPAGSVPAQIKWASCSACAWRSASRSPEDQELVNGPQSGQLADVPCGASSSCTCCAWAARAASRSPPYQVPAGSCISRSCSSRRRPSACTVPKILPNQGLSCLGKGPGLLLVNVGLASHVQSRSYGQSHTRGVVALARRTVKQREIRLTDASRGERAAHGPCRPRRGRPGTTPQGTVRSPGSWPTGGRGPRSSSSVPSHAAGMQPWPPHPRLRPNSTDRPTCRPPNPRRAPVGLRRRCLFGALICSQPGTKVLRWSMMAL